MCAHTICSRACTPYVAYSSHILVAWYCSPLFLAVSALHRYYVDCTVTDNANLDECLGGSDLTCVSACPAELPFYNDTSMDVVDSANLLQGVFLCLCVID